MTTIHMISNAHLDPVWLWHWQRGSDEALATCRSACDILDDYPEVRFTRGEAWVYDQVRQLDPALFRRIRRHIAAGRWEVVNGWWVQPDVNLPTEEAILQSARLGHAWMKQHLGLKSIRVAYNVDSFGQGAFLPRMIRRLGQRYYVMMRPDQNEHPLPSSLFRWRSPDGVEVLTHRICGGYAWWGRAANYDLTWKLDEVLKLAPAGVDHLAAFYGVGDHGGGPTRAAIDWILAHRDYKPGVRLEFSTLGRYFGAVEKYRRTMPVVVGELQMHAVGCYAVCGALKRDLRAVELAAIDAGGLLARRGFKPPRDAAATMERVWRTVCFNQFHDILPGSSIAEAVSAQRAQIGGARFSVDELVHATLRDPASLPRRCPVKGHRVQVVNRLARPWRGLVEADLWIDGARWQHHLQNEKGGCIPTQPVESPALMSWEPGTGVPPRILMHVDLKKAASRAFAIVEGCRDDEAASLLGGASPAFTDGVLSNGLVSVRFGAAGVQQVSGADGTERLAEPMALQIVEDYSDTWSHGIDRFSGPVLGAAAFGAPVGVEAGILRAMVRLEGMAGQSPVRLFVWLERNDLAVYLRLDTNYRERFTVLKARIAPAGGIDQRRDLVAGGWIERGPDGREYPLLHAATWTSGRRELGVVLPDTFAIDIAADAARPTLIRNNIHAMDGGNKERLQAHPRQVERVGTDEGPQSLRFALALDAAAEQAELENRLDRQQRPPYVWDDYAGISRVHYFEK